MQSVADLTYLRQVTSNDVAMMRFFIESYLQNAPACMKDLERHAANKNWSGVMKAAHTFRPQVTYMGLTEIISLVQEVEDDAASGMNTETISARAKRIMEVGTAALEELRKMLPTLDATVAE